jgi:hypothetical protein
MNKRISVCLIGGVIAGLICLTLGFLGGSLTGFSSYAVAGLFLNRVVLGFTIGISRLKVHYLLHGVLIGGLVSLISSLSFLDNAPANFIAFTMAGMTFGLLIELLATKAFKAPRAV